MESSEQGNKFAVNVTAQFVLPSGGDEGTLQLDIPELDIKHKQSLILGQENQTDGVSMRKGAGGLLMATFSTLLMVDEGDVELWWPAGYGQQFLYDVVVSFTPALVEQTCARADDKPATRRLLDTVVAAAAEDSDYLSDTSTPVGETYVAGVAALPAACAAVVRHSSIFRRRIGFRKVELVRLPIELAVQDLFPQGERGWNVQADFYQQKDSSDGHWAQTQDGIWQHFAKTDNQSTIDGESFYFKVNGVPIYMKVCSWMELSGPAQAKLDCPAPLL